MVRREYASSLGACLKKVFHADEADQFDDLLRALDAAESAVLGCD
jgi:hypothetical protein